MKKRLSILFCTVAVFFGIMPIAYAGMGGAAPAAPDPKYLPYDNVGHLSEGLAWIYEVGHYDTKDQFGFMDATGKVVIKPQYDDVRAFNDGLAAVKIGDKWGFIDKTGKHVIEPQYSDTFMFSEGLAPVAKDGKVFYIDKNGAEVFASPSNDVFNFMEGLAGFKVNGKWGFMDTTGQEVIKPQYDQAYSFSDGLATVKLNGKWAFIDKSGHEVIKPQYEDAHPFTEGVAAVRINGKWGFMDKAEKLVIAPQYDEVQSGFSEGAAVVSKGYTTGYIDKTGKEITGFQSDFAGSPFHDGIAVVSDGGQRSSYLITNPLTSSAPMTNTPAAPATDAPAAGEKRIDIRGSKGSYITFNNVVRERQDGPEITYIAKAPVTITFHGDDLFFQNAATVPAYERVPFAVKKYVQTGEKTVYDEVVRKPDSFNGHLYVTGNYVILSKPGAYHVVAAPVGTDSSGAIIEIAGDDSAVETGHETEPASVTSSAQPTASKVLVNGKEVSFEAYNINGNNYLKLRDLAMAVNGTQKNFEVSWDGSKNAISLTSGKAYTPDGTELVASDKPAAKEAKPNAAKIYANGSEVRSSAYNIDGNNYFKLRDIAKVFNFGITWNGNTNTIGIDTKADYKE